MKLLLGLYSKWASLDYGAKEKVLMKVLSEFYIQSPSSKISDFPDLVAKMLPNYWQRDEASENIIARESGNKVEMFCFTYSGTDFPEAKLWIAYKDKPKSNLYISNVVPTEVGELNDDQYNGIVKRFASDVSQLSLLSTDFIFKIEDSSKSVEDFMTEASAKKLRLFSVAANKSTGSAHPSDEERWLDFIVSLVTEGTSLSETELTGLLVEDEGWSEEIAADLASEYRIARRAIEAYRKNIKK